MTARKSIKFWTYIEHIKAIKFFSILKQNKNESKINKDSIKNTHVFHFWTDPRDKLKHVNKNFMFDL